MARIGSHPLPREDLTRPLKPFAAFVGGGGDDVWPPPGEDNQGNDNLRGLDGNDVLDGGGGNDVIDGGNDQDVIHGGSGDDTLYGGVGDDRIYAGSGVDTIYGDGGGDINYNLKIGNDHIYLIDPRVSYVDGGGNDLDYVGFDFRTSDVGVYVDFRQFDYALPQTSFVHANNGDTSGNLVGIDRLEFFYGSLYNDVLNLHDYQYDLTFFNDSDPELPEQDGTAVDGYAGNDTIYGGWGADILNGGADNDHVDGGKGNDRIDGSTGDDTILGGPGNDTLVGGAGADMIDGEGGDDTISGGGENDTLIGGPGINILNGEGGEDDLEDNGGASGTTLNGGEGDDFLYSEVLTTVYDGGAGNDRLSLDLGDGAAPLALDFRAFVSGGTFALGSGSMTNVEWILSISGSSADDVIYLGDDTGETSLLGDAGVDRFYGNASGNYMNGGIGNDILNGNGGGDILQGSVGDDTLDGGAGEDYLVGDEPYTPGGAPYAGNDRFYVDSPGDVVIENAGGGNDVVISNVSYTLGAGQEIETLQTYGSSSTAAINFNGNEFGQTILGNAAANSIDGKGGADLMRGYAGNDIYYVDNALDKVIEAAAGGSDTVITSVSFALASGQEVETLRTYGSATTAAINLTGNAFGQVIFGNAAANLIDGKGGADDMRGYGGNDTYYVDNGLDKVTEAAGAGNDTVITSVSFALASGQEVETLRTYGSATTAAINLTGNAFGQVIFGNAAANLIDGKGGADDMRGYGGNDTYYVDNGLDKVIEAAGAGNDTIITSVSFALASGQEVETLRTYGSATTVVINLTGNEFGQAIFGNAAANLIDGKGGADDMRGYGGNDTYYVDNGLDKVIEAAGAGNDTVITSVSFALASGQEVETLRTYGSATTAAINLTGNAFGQVIFGNAAANVIDGKGGSDALYGYVGADTFAFTTALDGGNVDRVADFAHGTDTIALDHKVFGSMAPGALGANAFVTGTAAGDADDRILYDSATGHIFYDADGSGGGAAILFATLNPGTALAASDFHVI